MREITFEMAKDMGLINSECSRSFFFFMGNNPYVYLKCERLKVV